MTKEIHIPFDRIDITLDIVSFYFEGKLIFEKPINLTASGKLMIFPIDGKIPVAIRLRGVKD